jgi:hypothetical protein
MKPEDRILTDCPLTEGFVSGGGCGDSENGLKIQ